MRRIMGDSYTPVPEGDHGDFRLLQTICVEVLHNIMTVIYILLKVLLIFNAYTDGMRMIRTKGLKFVIN